MGKKKPLILLLGGSIKSRASQKIIVDNARNLKTEEELREYTERALREKKLSNSERGLMNSAWGTKDYDVQVKYIRLNQYFLPNGGQKNIKELLKEVGRADGIIIGSPVYFGAWSSLCQELYEAIDFDLFPRVVGFVVSGAKRNGGQETTITFAGWDLMGKGALIVNDGYPISQFGGSLWAGLVGHSAENDDFGVRTAIGVGKRVAETTLILQAGDFSEEPKIFYYPPKGKFSRCRACSICPNPEAQNKDYKCRYFDDDTHKVHPDIINSNIIIPTEYNLRFHERLRYLRRDNYRLTYHIACLPEPKYVPLFIKLNCALCRKHAKKYAQLIMSGRKKVKTSIPIYEPIGHEK
jgi:multimeric flavodoxin WrbA